MQREAPTLYLKTSSSSSNQCSVYRVESGVVHHTTPHHTTPGETLGESWEFYQIRDQSQPPVSPVTLQSPARTEREDDFSRWISVASHHPWPCSLWPGQQRGSRGWGRLLLRRRRRRRRTSGQGCDLIFSVCLSRVVSWVFCPNRTEENKFTFYLLFLFPPELLLLVVSKIPYLEMYL